jgi:hypothetical protein
LSNLNETWIFGQIFGKSSDIKSMKIRQVGAEVFHADRRTGGETCLTKQIVALRNFSNAPEKSRCGTHIHGVIYVEQ